MSERCGTGSTLEELEEAYERARQARIDRYYQGESASDMAERIVDLEDELGADVDGISTGMHADVAEAQCEIERLERALRLSEAKIGGAALYVGQANARSNMLENALTVYEGIADERDRYRLAWLSARRRAADEANFGMEALELRDAEIARLKAELDNLRKSTHGAPELEHVCTD
jgi:archaellum component FlaC